MAYVYRRAGCQWQAGDSQVQWVRTQIRRNITTGLT